MIIAGNKYTQQWTDAQMDAKFRWLAGDALPGPVVDQVLDMAWHFERVPDISVLIDLVQQAEPTAMA